MLLLKWKPPETPLVEEQRHDVLDVDLFGVVAEVDQDLRPLAEPLAHGEGRAPVGEVGVVEGRLVRLVLQEHPHALGHGRVDLVQALDHPVAALREGVLARVVRAVGEPQGEDVGARLARDLDAFEEVVRGLPAHARVRVADAAELVLGLLEEVGVDGPDAQSQGLGVAFQFAVVVDPVPRDVDRHRGTHAGELVHLRRVGELLERVAGHALLREDREARARVAVAPGGGLHPLGAQPSLPRSSRPPRSEVRQAVVGPFFRALQDSILLQEISSVGAPSRSSENLSRSPDHLSASPPGS